MDSTVLRFIEEHEHENIRELALKLKNNPDIDAGYILRQIAGKQVARTKIPAWYNQKQILYPEHLSLEQSSSEKSARYKASLCAGDSLADLTGGLGVDFSFMSRNYKTAVYVEKNEELANLATHNFEVLGLNHCNVVVGSAEDYLQTMPVADTIYIDPARRKKTGAKAISVEDCSPGLKEIGEILNEKARQVLIKLSPMLDISQALKILRFICEVHVVSVNNECKELLLMKPANVTCDDIVFHCVDIRDTETVNKYIFTQQKENTAKVVYADSIKKYLYEPNASVLKAGAFKAISEDYTIEKLHPNSHLYTSDRYENEFPGRRFIVEEIIPFKKKELKEKLTAIQKANITTRNFPLSVDEIRKRTKLKEGGENYIFATTMNNDEKVLIVCEKTDK